MKKSVYLLPFLIIVLFLILIKTKFYFRELFFVNCTVGSWNPPTCPTTCGNQVIQRRIPLPMQQGCTMPALSQECPANPCPVDCVVSDWSSCSGPCGTTGTQTRTVITQPVGSGLPCPVLSQSCTTDPCPIDCVVSAWSSCSGPCGTTGTKTRSIVTSPANGGEACPSLSESCNNIPCPPQGANFYNTVLGIFKHNPILGNL
jgi:hypothetical protein